MRAKIKIAFKNEGALVDLVEDLKRIGIEYLFFLGKIEFYVNGIAANKFTISLSTDKNINVYIRPEDIKELELK